ncbi:type II toxin-antitoxin system PemK/MazF family toxin, partial [Bacilli bacterium]
NYSIGLRDYLTISRYTCLVWAAKVELLEQIRTLDKQRLTDRITKLDEEMMKKINQALEISLGLKEIYNGH